MTQYFVAQCNPRGNDVRAFVRSCVREFVHGVWCVRLCVYIYTCRFHVDYIAQQNTAST